VRADDQQVGADLDREVADLFCDRFCLYMRDRSWRCFGVQF
jgi:hypothetical protein